VIYKLTPAMDVKQSNVPLYNNLLVRFGLITLHSVAALGFLDKLNKNKSIYTLN